MWGERYFLKKEMLLTLLVLFTGLPANIVGDIFPVQLAYLLDVSTHYSNVNIKFILLPQVQPYQSLLETLQLIPQQL